MLRELIGSSLGVRRRDREARWEHARRSPEKDHKTYRKNAEGYRISGRVTDHGQAPCRGSHPRLGRLQGQRRRPQGWSPLGRAAADGQRQLLPTQGSGSGGSGVKVKEG
ncbi:hypothetical protein BHM03_00021450 [Ensete ventricosum]|nr:hypothetical protein BHM03_00021450 [Ensete ventricosum]